MVGDKVGPTVGMDTVGIADGDLDGETEGNSVGFTDGI